MSDRDVKPLIGCISVIVFGLIFLGICLFGCAGSWVGDYLNPQTHTGILKDHYVKHSGESDDYFITVDVGDEVKTFMLRDSLAKWRWNSAKTYANLPPNGSVVVVETSGYEIGSTVFPIVQSIRTKNNK